jgi:hypothetical protein
MMIIISRLGFFNTWGHFTHEPRAVAMKLREPKRKCLKAVPTHFQNHVGMVTDPKCSVKSYVTGLSIKCYFHEFLFMRVLTHDQIEIINGGECSECQGLLVCVGLPPRGGF